MSVLDNLNTIDLHQLFTDPEFAFDFAYQYDMLYDGGVCESTNYCTGNYIIVTDPSQKYGKRLKCNICGKTKSYFYNSNFTRSHIEINEIFHLIYCWPNEYLCDIASHECNVNITTVTNFFQAFRIVCKFWYDQAEHMPIGGDGHNVEILEIWVFGGVCRETKEHFVIKVDQRDAATLIPIIKEKIMPGSIIHSDG